MRPGLVLPLSLAILASPAAAGIEVAGRVVDGDGRPFRGARVELVPVVPDDERFDRTLDGHLLAEPAAVTTAGEDGSFRLTAPEPGLFTVQVQAPGYPAMEHRLQPLLEPTELPVCTLSRGAELRVAILDEAGRPVPGALVAAKSRPAHRWPPRPVHWRPVFRYTRVDERGRVRLARLPGESPELRAWAPGFLPAGLEEAGGSRAELRLPAAGERLVEVRTPRGEPAPGVGVEVGSWGWPVGRSDESGRLAVPAPGPEGLGLKLIGPGFTAVGFRLSPHEEKGAREPKPEPAPTVFELPQLAALAGSVVDAFTRLGLAGALMWTADRSIVVARTDGKGAYRLRAAEGVELRLAAAAPGYRTQSASKSAEPGRAALPTIALEPSVRLAGSVLDSRGRPVAGAEVSVLPFNFRGWRFPGSLVRTGDDGRFVLGGLKPESAYRLRAERAGYSRAEIEVWTGEVGVPSEEVALVMRPGCRVFGRVVDSADRPVTGAEVSLTRPASGALATRLSRFEEPLRAATGEDGGFVLDDLGPGQLDLKVRATGFAPALVRGLEIPEEPAEVDLGTVVLEEGAVLVVEVADARGLPLEGVTVSANPSDRRRGFFDGDRRPAGETGPEGRLEIGELLAGSRVDVSVHREGYLSRRLSGVEVPAASPLAVRLEEGHTVSGRVLGSEGEPIAGASVRLERVGEGVTETTWMLGQRHSRYGARSGEHGTFEISGLLPGRYASHAEAEGHLGADGPEVSAGQRQEPAELVLTLTRGSALHGRVLGPGGRPAAGASVSVEKAGFAYLAPPHATADGDGAYRLEGLPAGWTTVAASDRGYAPVRKEVEISGAETSLDFQLEPGIEVSGRVSAVTGEPLAGASVNLEKLGGGVRLSTISRDDGTFRFASVAAGRYRPYAGKSGWAAGAEAETFEVAAAPVSGIEITLERGARIVGSVSGLSFDQIAALEVYASSPGTGAHRGAVDYEGRFRVETIGPGTWMVSAQVSGAGLSASETVEVTPGDEEVVVDLELGTGITLTGQVLINGRPLDAVQVSVQGLGAEGGGMARTDFEGRFLVGSLEAGSYRLMVRDYGRGVHHEKEVALDGDRDVLVEVEVTEVSGTVVDAATGGPLGGVVLSLRSDEPAAMALEARSDSLGRFAFGAVPAGSFVLHGEKRGYGAAETGFEVAVGEPVFGVELRLQASEGLWLEVFQPSGEPVRRAVAVLLDAAGNRLTGGHLAASAGGRIHLLSAPPGRWQVLVSADQLATASLDAEVPGAPVRVELPSTGWLTVEVPALAAEPSVATLTLTGPDGRAYRAAEHFGRQPQLRLFRGRLDRFAVPSGTWSLTVSAGDGRAWSAAVTIASGELARVTLE